MAQSRQAPSPYVKEEHQRPDSVSLFILFYFYCYFGVCSLTVHLSRAVKHWPILKTRQYDPVCAQLARGTLVRQAMDRYPIIACLLISAARRALILRVNLILRTHSGRLVRLYLAQAHS